MSNETINTISLSRAKEMLADLESNADGERRNLCEICRHNKIAENDSVVDQRSECVSPYRNTDLSGPTTKLFQSVYRCRLRERELKEYIEQIKNSINEETEVESWGTEDVIKAKKFPTLIASLLTILQMILLVFIIFIQLNVIRNSDKKISNLTRVINELRKEQTILAEKNYHSIMKYVTRLGRKK